MDDELQPRVDSAYLAKTFLTNLQGPKEDFLMDSREISPQQIASLSQGAEAPAREVPTQRPAEATDSEDEGSWLVSPTSTPHTRGSTPYATPGKEAVTSASAWESTSSPAAKRARQVPAGRDADGLSDSSMVSSSHRDQRFGSSASGLSRIPGPRPTGGSSLAAPTASRRGLSGDADQPSSQPQGTSRIPQPKQRAGAPPSDPPRPATSSSSSSAQPRTAADAGLVQQYLQKPADTRAPGSSHRRPFDTASEAESQLGSPQAGLSSRGNGRMHVPDTKRSPVAAYIYGPPARALSDTASEADTQPDQSSRKPPWRYGKAPSYAAAPDVVPLPKPSPGTTARPASRGYDKELDIPSATTSEEPTTSSPPEALHHAPPAAAVHEQLPQSPVEDQNSHHLLLSGRQANAAPLQTDPAADSLRSPPGTGAVEQIASSPSDTAELLNKYAPPGPAASQPTGTDEHIRPPAKLDQGLLVIDPEITTPRAPGPSPPEAPPPRAQDIQFLEIPFQRAREPPKELELPQASPAALDQPATSKPPQDPAAAEQQPLGRSSNPQTDPSKLPLTSAVGRAKASPRGAGKGPAPSTPGSQTPDRAKSKGCCGCVVM